MSENLYVKLNDRSKQIFKTVVETYLETGSPSGSETILKKGSIDISSASIRSILADLQKEGLLYAPHTSSGRLPTDKGMRLFVDGLNKMGTNKASDANSTMRVTFGNVLSYDLKDAVKYNFYTTLEGVMEKQAKTEDKNHEFYVPSKLKELYDKKDYGQYANKQGELPVGFLSNNDITGGNSGSPVINARGELIGTAFDGNWEAMSGDIYFEPNIQRTISVDIRYTLFIIDKYAGATHLIDEMNLIKSERKLGNNPKPKGNKKPFIEQQIDEELQEKLLEEEERQFQEEEEKLLEDSQK